MKKRTVKKTIIIFTVWLISVIAVSIIYTRIESSFYRQKAEKDLSSQARALAKLIPSVIRNNYYSNYCLLRMQSAKLDTLSLALEETDDTEEVQAIMEEFRKTSGVAALAVHDRDGSMIYDSGNHILENYEFGMAQDMVGADLSDTSGEATDLPESYMEEYLSSQFLQNDETMIAQSIKGGQWILGADGIMTDDEKKIISLFDWRNVFSKIRIGNTGNLLVIDDQDGTVLSYGDRTDPGRIHVDALDLRIEGEDHAASLEELKETFNESDQLASVSVEGKDCLAVRVKAKDALMLALMPVSEIKDTVYGVMGLLLLVLFLATGVCVLYSILHVHQPEEASLKSLGHFVWNKTLGGRLVVIAVIAGIAVFISGVFLESLLRYAHTFSYCEGRASEAAALYTENADAVDEMKLWFQDECLTRCRIAGMILKRKDLQDVTPGYLQRLSDSLGAYSIHVFDSEGNLVVTNAPYDGVVISEDDAFHVLLEGRPELIVDQEEDPVTGNTVQKAGISVLDENGKCSGMILITGDVSEISSIMSNLDTGNVFERIGLTDGTSMLAVLELATAENEGSDDAAGGYLDMITYNAQVKNGRYQTGLDSFNYAGYSVEEIGIVPDMLQDYYNGSLRVLNHLQFASIRRAGKYFFLVMLPQVTISADNFIHAAILTAFTLLIILLVVLVSCLQRKKIDQAEPETADAPAVEENETSAVEPAAKEAGIEDGVLTALENLLNRKKANFEERWPKDCIRWKEKTINEKYLSSLKVLLIVSLLIVFTNAIIAGNSSVWYYIFSGEWNTGMNLHSFTVCLVEIWVLFIIKIIAHKILFLSARALDTQGETICMLLDSFSGYALLITGIFLCLGNFGINAMALSLTAGVAGVIFSIGCQSIVADILAGILMVFEGVVYVGDFLFFNGKPEFVQSIGVRTTRLKFFGEITIVRNNEFKNYVQVPGDVQNRIVSYLTIDLNESLERVEEILEKELPLIQDRLCDLGRGNVIGPKYRGVSMISEKGIELVFDTFCRGRYFITITRHLNRELKLMCERCHINIAITKIDVSSRSHCESDEIKAESICPGDEPGKKGEQRI